MTTPTPDTKEIAERMARHLFNGRPTLVYDPAVTDYHEVNVIPAEEYIQRELDQLVQQAEHEAAKGTLENCMVLVANAKISFHYSPDNNSDRAMDSLLDDLGKAYSMNRAQAAALKERGK